MERFSPIIEVPTENIKVSPKDFQGRQSEFSADTVRAIVAKGTYDKSASPIVVWEDDRVTLPGNYIVISGHSRFEAVRQLRAKGDKTLNEIPVKIFNGTLQEAREYAVLESNRGGTEEGLLSDIKAFKMAKSLGKNKEWLRGNFRPDSKFEKLEKLSYLADNSRFIEELTKNSQVSFPYLERNSIWVGSLRKNLPALTDSHEREIFNWLYTGDKKALNMSKDRFMQEIDKRVNRIDFEPEKPLNFANSVSANPYTDPINEEIKAIEKEIDRLARDRDRNMNNIKEATKQGKTDIIPKFQQAIRDIDTIVLRKLQEQDKLRASVGKMERETITDLFSDPAPAPEKLEPVTVLLPEQNTGTMTPEIEAKIAKLKAALALPGIGDDEKKIYRDALAALGVSESKPVVKAPASKNESATSLTKKQLGDEPRKALTPIEKARKEALQKGYSSSDFFDTQNATGEVKIVQLSMLTVNKKNPQSSIDNAATRMIQAAKGEIPKRGPITVEQINLDVGGKSLMYVVLDGNATVTALRRLNYRTVPVIVKDAAQAKAAFTTGQMVTVKKYGWVMRVTAYEKGMVQLENTTKNGGTGNGNPGTYTPNDLEPYTPTATPPAKISPIDQNPDDAKNAEPVQPENQYTKAKYKGVFGDYDGDGILNVDDPHPSKPGDKETVEEIKLSDEIAALIDFRKDMVQTEKDFVEVLRKKAQGETDILSRTKTPYSIVNKMRRKMTAGPNQGLTDMIGAMVIFDTHEKVVAFKEMVNRGELGQVIEFDDYYAKPKAGYMAYHWNLVFKGSPVELQLKSERLKKIAGYTHTMYKTGGANADRQLKLSQAALLADKGNTKVAGVIDALLKDSSKTTAFLKGEINMQGLTTGKSKTPSTSEPAKKETTPSTGSAKTIAEEIKQHKGAMSRETVLRIAEKIHASRTDKSRKRDEGSTSRKVLAPTEDNLRRWARNPGAYDISTVDTKGTAPTTKEFKKDFKPRKQTFWDRLWSGDN